MLYLSFNQKNLQNGKALRSYNKTQQKQVDSISLEMLEAQIKQVKYQETQNYSNITLYQNSFCRYNPNRKAQLLCSRKNCDNHSIICAEQTCKCASDHRKCIFIAIKPFFDKIRSKLSKPISQQIQLYFQMKSVIYQHMINRLSQESEALRDWQQNIQNKPEKYLFLYGINQPMFCDDPKVAYQKIRSGHQQCHCSSLKIEQKFQTSNQEKTIKTICKNIQSKYSSMFNYFDQKVEKLQFHKQCANLNTAQFLFVDYLKNTKYFSFEEFKNEGFDLNRVLKDVKIAPGSLIHFARKNMKEQSKNIDTSIFSIHRFRKIWKRYAEKTFRLLIEGNAMNELFIQTKKVKDLSIQSAYELLSRIDQTIEKISQGQKHLFSSSMFKKKQKLTLRNLNAKNLKMELKKHTGKKFNEVYITNDRYLTAVNDIQTIKELGNLKNVTKLEVRWCQRMEAQLCMQILENMPRLKHLALLGGLQRLPQNFTHKLCQFKQLVSYYVSHNSHPDYYRSMDQDVRFIGQFQFFKKYSNMASLGQLLELSNLPNLENIEIDDPAIRYNGQVIQNMKKLKHVTLIWVDFIDEVLYQKQLRTLSLIEVVIYRGGLNRVISNNPHLNTIIIKSRAHRDSYSDETIQLMTDLIQLQNLCISRNQRITGKHFDKFGNLKMLEISGCSRISKQEMKEALAKMHKLEHLNLSYNQWVDDEIVMSIQQCEQLVYLNIRVTSVQGSTFKHLRWLNRLNTLLCGHTKINGNSLIELTMCISSITKLSIEELDVSDDELLKISVNCQGITHLNIDLTKITEQSLLKMKQLKVVRKSVDNQDLRKKLAQKGIQVY